MRTEVNKKVAIATDDLSWAKNAFAFEWGRSALAERLRALELLMGSQTEVIRAANLAPSTYKSVLSRNGDMASERIGALAQATNLSLEYLIFGKPTCPRDAACEEKRFDLAVRLFPIPSLPTRREARAFLINEVRGVVEERIAQLTAPAEPRGSRKLLVNTQPAGFSLIAPLRPATRLSRDRVYVVPESSPLALDNDWLAERGLTGADLVYLTITGEEGGSDYPAGSLVVLDNRSTVPKPGAVFAMRFGEEVQLRRFVTRLSKAVELVHVNPSWPVEVLDNDNPPQLLGMVIFCFTPQTAWT